MKERKLEGTYSESALQDEWYGHYYRCNECGFTFMLEHDLNKCFCPNCGRYIIWNEAKEDDE